MMEEGGLLDSLEDIKNEIRREEHLYNKLITDQKTLAKAREDRERLAKEFRNRVIKITNALEQDKTKHNRDMDSKKEKVDSLQQQQEELREQLDMTETALKEQEAKNSELENASNVITVVPDREVVFRGATGDVASPCPFDVKTHIKYPMDGGTMLITFEEEIVAQNVLSLRSHKVTLEGECFITVEARPIELRVPSSIEMDTRVCPRSILVSNLPDLDSETLLDKLELHFTKQHHRGGEVASRHFQEDAGNAVLVFRDDGVALELTQLEYHKVSLEKSKKQTVRTTPFVNGTITSLETKMLTCGRSVLLTGIPAVMEAEGLQDMLEIYFQKGSNGGGEISNTLYNPLGRTTTAFFEADV